MVRQAMRHQQQAAAIAASLLLSAVVLFRFRADYFRPYTDAPQSSLGSSDLHNFAWASTMHANLLDLFFVAKRVTLDGALLLNPHYTNGYPLLARAYFAAFGDGLIASRMLPICIIAVGGLLFLSRLERELRNPLVFLALPLLYLSPIGRDAGSFEMIEPAHFLILGLSAVVLYDSPFPRWVKVVCILVCVCIYQVSAPFILAIVVADYLRSKDRATLVTMGLALFAAALVVAAAFIQAGGPDALAHIVLHRAGLDSPDPNSAYSETVTFADLNRGFFARVHQNMAPVFFFFSGVEIFILIWQRRYLLPSVYLGYIGYMLVLRNFVGMHYFTFLPFDFFVLAALLSLLWRIAAIVSALPGRAMPKWRGTGLADSAGQLVHVSTVMLVLAFLVIDIVPRTRMYTIDTRVRADFDAITAYVADHDVSKCRTFEVTGLETDERIVYFLLARHINRGSGEVCKVQLTPRL